MNERTKMSKSVYENVKADRLFKDATKQMNLKLRDYQLISLVCATAERLLGESKEQLAKAEGRIETEQTKTKAALLLGFNKESFQLASSAFFTPIDEIPRLIQGQKKTKNDDNSENFDIIEVEAVDEKKEEVKDVSSDIEKDAKGVFEKLPSIVQWPVLIVRNTIIKMSPLMIAIWIVLIVLGSITYAKYSISRVQSTYELSIRQRDDYKKQLLEANTKVFDLKGQVAKMPDLLAQRDDLSERVAGLTEEIAKLKTQLEKERSDFDAEKQAKQKEYDKKFDDLAQNQEKAVQEALKTLRGTNTKLTQANDNFKRLVEDLKGELSRTNSSYGSATDRINTLISTNEGLREDLRDARKRASDNQRELDKYESLIPFVQDLTRSIDTHFFKKADVQLYQRRDCFRSNYKRLYSASEEILKANNIREDMRFSDGKISERSLRACGRELY